jgi:hypothetical protein
VVLGINTDRTSTIRTDQFISLIGFDTVLDDPTGVGYAVFGPGGSASRYVIINGVADSPTHKQWEVLFSAQTFLPGVNEGPPPRLIDIIESVKPPSAAPQITAHPAAQSVRAGGAVVLNVTVTGSAPLMFRWFRDGQPLDVPGNPELRLDAAQAQDSGVYTVEVSNSAGKASSNAALVTVCASVNAAPLLQLDRPPQAGVVEFTLLSTPGTCVRLERSSDLKTWGTIHQIRLAEPHAVVRDTPPMTAGAVFYRAVAE